MAKLARDALNDLSSGAVFLATGGGGDPYVAQLIAEQALEKYGPVELMPPDAVADDDYVVAIGAVGAPTVSLELLPSISMLTPIGFWVSVRIRLRPSPYSWPKT